LAYDEYACQPWLHVSHPLFLDPGLSLLINMYRAHDGRGIRAEQIASGLEAAIHSKFDSGLEIARVSFRSLGNPGTIDLEDLNAHGSIEHDASLTRKDSIHGSALLLSPPRLQAVLADSKTDYLDIDSIAKGRTRVEALSAPFSDAELAASQAEGGSILMVMSERPVPGNGEVDDYKHLRASKARIAIWLSDERLPVELGWHRPYAPIFNTTLFTIGAAVAQARERLEASVQYQIQSDL
jgi:hypothetical protein